MVPQAEIQASDFNVLCKKKWEYCTVIQLL